MSFWSHNVELYDEVITNALPDEWKDRVESGEIELSDVPEDVVYKAAVSGEEDYWGTRIDEAVMKKKERLSR